VVTADLRLVSEDKHIVLELDLPTVEIDRTQQYPLPALVDTYTYKAQTDIGWMGGTADSWPYEIKSGYLKEDNRVGYIDMRIFGYCGLREEDIAILNGEKKPREEGDLAYLKKLKKLKKDIDIRRPAIIDAVNNLAKAEYIIIDLRKNGGGNPHAVQLLCSLFMNEGFPLNTIESREGQEFKTQSFNTLSKDELPMEKRLTNPRVFVLIGPQTFSAAEEFTNNMKVLGRATIVGAPSGGGANPGGDEKIGKNLKLFIPRGRAINPLQRGNWEGVGIIPDQVVPAEEALEKTIALIKE
jgi:C-terminal processing protease CtpA/Prc